MRAGERAGDAHGAPRRHARADRGGRWRRRPGRATGAIAGSVARDAWVTGFGPFHRLARRCAIGAGHSSNTVTVSLPPFRGPTFLAAPTLADRVRRALHVAPLFSGGRLQLTIRVILVAFGVLSLVSVAGFVSETPLTAVGLRRMGTAAAGTGGPARRSTSSRRRQASRSTPSSRARAAASASAVIRFAMPAKMMPWNGKIAHQ